MRRGDWNPLTERDSVTHEKNPQRDAGWGFFRAGTPGSSGGTDLEAHPVAFGGLAGTRYGDADFEHHPRAQT
jgi:hypothetical protein